MVSVGESMLLQLKVPWLYEMAKSTACQAAGATFKSDHDILMAFMGSNYETKTAWRRN